MKTALVLAGGGAKGAYQAGSIKALRDLGFKFDIVTGTSIGALNGLLVTQQDYDALYSLWQTLTLKEVMKYPVDFDFSIESLLSQKNLILSFFQSYVHKKGADITPLITLINGYYDSHKFMNSNIDYGLVTVTYPSLIPQEITKKDMTASNAVEYAIASASCFPAFPVYHIDKQGYIDGGYYDNLPISLAMSMGAEQMVTIELQEGPIHEYFLNRPNIIRIRPTRDLGNFLDFDRKVLDQRIILGYLDTYKVFRKYRGYTYTFTLDPVPVEQQKYFYNKILELENAMNHVSTRVITDRLQPLTKYLLAITYKSALSLEDYLLLGLETTLDTYEYKYDTVYSYLEIAQEVLKSFEQEYSKYSFQRNLRTSSLKKIMSLIKEVSLKEAIYHIYDVLVTKQKIDKDYLASSFPQPFIVALYLYTTKKFSEK